MSVKYCPTGEMVTDCFTKPLQGTPFRKFQDDIMNVDPQLIPTMDHRSVLEPDSHAGNIQNDASGWIEVEGKKKKKTMTGKVIQRSGMPQES